MEFKHSEVAGEVVTIDLIFAGFDIQSKVLTVMFRLHQMPNISVVDDAGLRANTLSLFGFNAMDVSRLVVGLYCYLSLIGIVTGGMDRLCYAGGTFAPEGFCHARCRLQG